MIKNRVLNYQFKKFSVTFNHILCLAVIVFLFLNSLKTVIISYFVATSTFIPLIKIMTLKFLLCFFLNSVIFLILFRLKNRSFLLVFYMLQTIYLFTHFAYFLFFNNIFHIRQFIFQFSEGSAIIRNFLIPKDLKYLIVFFDLPFFLFIVTNYPKLNDLIRIPRKTINLLKTVSFVSVIFLLLFFRKIEDFNTDINDRNLGETEIVRRYGLPANDLLDLLLYRNEKSLIKDFEYGKTIIFRNNTGSQFKNIICIQVEALDARIIHLKYKGEYVTPFLHRLSSQCIYYPYMLMYPRAGCTSDTEFATINSAIPLNNFPSMKLRNYDYPNSIVKRLLKSNFESIAFHNNIGSFFNRNVSFFKMGFREFYDLKKMKLKEEGWGAADHDVMNYVRNKLQEQKLPFLYYIITMSSHEPYYLVRRYYVNERYNDIDKRLIRDYFNSMSYVDKVLEDFVSFVKNNIKNTYIFIYNDNSPALVKGSVIKYSNRRLEFSPLFIITPDNKKYTERDRVVSVLDLAPSILYASGISFEIMTKGVNLLDFPNKEDLVPIRNGEACDRKYLFNQFIKNEYTDGL